MVFIESQIGEVDQFCALIFANLVTNFIGHMQNTMNEETFVGLNFCSVHSIWIFMVILSRYKAREQHVFTL